MRAYDLILKKRDGKELWPDELEFLITGYLDGSVPDYQMSSLLMAIYFQGLSMKEMTVLTRLMVNSGERIDLSEIKGKTVDKHSTGGVGDKTSLILGPMVAAAGGKMPKLSGRGLGHTGGTIDKLESFNGFSAELTIPELIDQVNKIGIAIIGQTKDLVPADKKLYALRDVTATVENNGLIASSVMSKKMATGADVVVLDVKVGSGAFMKTLNQAEDLAEKMVHIGESMGKKVTALITDMEQPLGNAVGNSLEVIEAMETLQGNGPEDITHLCVELGAQILDLSGLTESVAEGREKMLEVIRNGAAFEKFKEFIQYQKGDVKQVEDPTLLPQAKYKEELFATGDGYVSRLDAMTIGLISLSIGAGRETVEDQIDLSSGIYFERKVGDKIKNGELLATIYGNDKDKLAEARNKLMAAYSFSQQPVPYPKLIHQVVSGGKVMVD